MLNSLPLPKPKPIKVLRAKKRKKKTSRQLLEKQADILVREIVLKRDGFCVCPAPKNGHGNIRTPGHLISRTRRSVKWGLNNVHEQCQSCNFIHELRPEIFTSWFIRTFGTEAYQSLVMESENTDKLSVEQLQTLCDELSAIKSRQEHDKNFRPRYTQEEILNGSWRKEYEQRSSDNPMQKLLQRSSLDNREADRDRQHHEEGRVDNLPLL
jgi:hypothetical protein